MMVDMVILLLLTPNRLRGMRIFCNPDQNVLITKMSNGTPIL